MNKFGTSIWNLMHPQRHGASNLDILKGGREWYGTVIKQVRADYKIYNKKFKTFSMRNSKFLVHDEENFSVAGDKVIIRSCRKIGNQKNYYLRKIVKPFPRTDFYVKEKTDKEKQLDLDFQKTYQQYYDSMIKKATIRNKKEEQAFKAKLKAKAMSRVIINLRQMEKEQRLEQDKLDKQKIDSSKLQVKSQREVIEYLKS